MFLNFNEMLYLYEEDSGGNTGTETEVEVKTENTETETIIEESEVVEVEPKKTKVAKKKVEKKPDVDAEALKAENQKLKVENKLQLLCNDNSLDASTVKELLPDFDNMTEESIEAFITKLVELTPKLSQSKKPVATPRIIPTEPKKDTKTEYNQKMSEYFGVGGGSKRVFGQRS